MCGIWSTHDVNRKVVASGNVGQRVLNDVNCVHDKSSWHDYDNRTWMLEKWLGWEEEACLWLHAGGDFMTLAEDGAINSKKNVIFWQK